MYKGVGGFVFFLDGGGPVAEAGFGFFFFYELHQSNSLCRRLCYSNTGNVNKGPLRLVSFFFFSYNGFSPARMGAYQRVKKLRYRTVTTPCLLLRAGSVTGPLVESEL